MSVWLFDGRNIFCLTTPKPQSPSLPSIPPSSVPPDPPTGSASFSVSPTVAPQLLCMLSWVTWINDNSRGFTDQAHPLHNLGRSAADPHSFWLLTYSTIPHLAQLTLFTLLSHPLCLSRCTQHMVQWVCSHMASVTSIYPELVQWKLYFWTQNLASRALQYRKW